MAFLYEIKNNEITITGYVGAVSHLQIPDRIGGLPVTAVAKSAFSRRNDLVYIRLPETVRSLHMFAFYFCRNLKKAVLCDVITDYYDGVFRQCQDLLEIELTVNAGNYTVLRDILSENDRTVRVTLHLPDGTARLVFPDYVLDFTEDTFARAFHSSITGTGFTYRECVNKNGISFREYDQMFDRLAAVNVPLASETALDRLTYPYSLGEQPREAYESFVRENDTAAAQLAVAGNREDWLEMLRSRSLLGRKAAEAGAEAASAAGKTRFVSLFLGFSDGASGTRRLTL